MATVKKSEKSLTLEKLRLAFKQWRAHKTTHKIPDELWEQINVLAKSHQSHSIIRKTLGISGSQFNKHVSCSKNNPAFVEVSLNAKAIKNKSLKIQPVKLPSLVDADIYRLDGSRLSIKHLNNNEVANLIQTFLG